MCTTNTLETPRKWSLLIGGGYSEVTYITKIELGPKNVVVNDR